MKNVYDKNRRPIMVGDVLKVFHFIGARKKTHYMYKHVVGVKYIDDDNAKYFIISHLDLKSEPYLLRADGEINELYEIIQGYGDTGIPFHEREALSNTGEK